MNLVRTCWRFGESVFGSGGQRPRPVLGDNSDDEATAQQRLRIMIVEDELFVAMHLESVLEELGYEVTGIVSTGERAVAEVVHHRPDIVLMDINLGAGMNGIKAAQQIRSGDDAGIIFVSAYGDASTRASVEAALPGSRLLSKPVTPWQLKGAIEAQTERRH